MEANIPTSLLCSKPLQFFITTKSSSFSFPIHLQTTNNHRLRHTQSIRAAVGPGNGNERENLPSVQPPLPTDSVEIRFKRGSRKRIKQQQQGGGSGISPPPPPPKEWEVMTLQEKAVKLYMGEKGLLFWLNKAAYASIFIIIGAWILFRFVGPSLGLYQLDAPQPSP
ncbi:hypothetical protein GIB67_003881 [Kingdonia uniflora]|uniref:Uncharacterized protein n=1 Tax=Kingdonia uniflora TaxID=39325 RepID=A0A7J7LJS5_9MAGN|nr:hypothetical protein GIB67_003881 [Kingdonia uniflora]